MSLNGGATHPRKEYTPERNVPPKDCYILEDIVFRIRNAIARWLNRDPTKKLPRYRCEYCRSKQPYSGGHIWVHVDGDGEHPVCFSCASLIFEEKPSWDEGETLARKPIVSKEEWHE